MRARTVLLVVVLLILVGGFFYLLGRNGASAPPPVVVKERRGAPRKERYPDKATKGSTAAACGVDCASEYFAAWSWPADGSCKAGLKDGLPVPDARCTPGGVTPGVTAETLRDPGFRTRCVRNCQSSETQKHVAYEWYGMARPAENQGEGQVCELDHLVPLELGGADGLGNIWPECGPDEVALRERYFKRKDKAELYLAKRVKAGEMGLDEAQRGIAADWTQYLGAAEGP